MNNESGTGFTEEYVKKLRDEAANWRTKYRDLEGQVAFTQVDSELAKRGVKADPTWVTINEGQSISEAVDALIELHPHLVTVAAPTQQTSTQEKPSVGQVRPTAPRPMASPQANTNAPGPDASGLLKDRNFQEIKKDPVARAKLRDYYRSLISSSSNQGPVPE